MKVQILEKNTDKLITEILINFGMIGVLTKREDLEHEAWLSAVEDKTVEPHKKSCYRFLIIE